MGEWLACAMIVVTLAGFAVANTSIDGWSVYRDRMLIVLATGLILFLSLWQVPFALIFVLLFLRYRGYEQSDGVLLWSFLAFVFFIVERLSVRQSATVVVGIILGGLLQSLLAYVDFTVSSWYAWHKKPRTPICGSLGNRTYLASYLAMIAPLLASERTLVPFCIVALAILLCSTKGAMPGFLVGVLIAWPAARWPLVGFVILALFLMAIQSHRVLWLPRFNIFGGSSVMDSLGVHKGRLRIWVTAIVHTCRWPQILIGHGHNSFSQTAFYWAPSWGSNEGFVHCHNDFVQLFYEHGLIGVLALAILIHQIWPYLGFNALTGSAVAYAMCAMTTFPSHIAPVGITALVIVALIAKGFAF